MLLYNRQYNKKTKEVINNSKNKDQFVIDNFTTSYLDSLNRLIVGVDSLLIDMKNIAEKTNQLNTNSDQDIERLNITKLYINDMYNKLTDTLELSKSVLEKCEIVGNEADKRKNEINRSISKYENVKSTVKDAYDAMKELQNRIIKVESLINLIQEIADQTNLLALNASIEAARAGEHGKGFAIVANEVKKLSQKTSNFTNEISNTIKEIIKESLNTSKAIQNTVEVIEEQAKLMEDTSLTINSIIDTMVSTNKAIIQLTKANSESFDVFEKVSAYSQEILSSIEQNIISIKGIDESIQKENKLVNDLTGIMQELKSSIVELFSVIEKEENELIVVTEEYPPFVINDKDMGIDMEILKEIFERRNNIKLKVFFAPFDTCIELIKRGQADLISTLSYTKEREEFIDFSKPYRDESKYILLKSKNSSIHFNSYSDLRGKRIGIITSYTYPNKFIKDNAIMKEGNSKLEPLLEKLFIRQIDAILINQYIGEYFIKVHSIDDKIDVSSYVLEAEEKFDARMGFSKAKNLKHYVDIFNNELQKITTDGTLEKIQLKYKK
ncbi:methyl-accepting chemotaxis protein [Caloramator sp. CAR-1]|uniref:methyl-accepting chemotaxis protein n=1 Tax=Caloramator sp. CAR-1 TaxID=3062777 RepID=UPI0026E153D4|nr:methyl-accepting chemotaxis protein [Caloramator sp. CAR-1]MDO6354069.1 methyl-accepting chemotaxis protein [Caloramator sp. CAR-1]